MDDGVDYRTQVVRIYLPDLAWLKSRQIEASMQANRWLTLPEVLHALINGERDRAAAPGHKALS